MSRLVEILFDYEIKESLKTFVDVIYSIKEFTRKVFLISVKVLSPYNNKWVNAFSFMDRRFGLTILTFCRRNCLSFLKFEQRRKTCLAGSITLPQLQIGFSESRKF